jgi:CRP-like cAMP-binding protein
VAAHNRQYALPVPRAQVAHMCRYALASRVRVLGELHIRNYLDPNL